MATKVVDGKSKFNIYSNFTLSNDDVAVISLLYAPLIGSDAMMLYFAFASFLERNNLKSEELTHQDIYDLYSLEPQAFIRARVKLEGIGLLITYEDSNSYVYVITPPLTAKNFIKDATLGLYLYSKIQENTFEFIYNHFKIEKVEKSRYTNITKSFDEVFTSRIDNDSTFKKFQYILGRKANQNIQIKHSSFDFDFFLSQINKDFLEVGVTSEFKDRIVRLSFVYGFDELEMIGLYNDSINKSGLFDYRLLKNKAKILFNYKRNMKAPILEEKSFEYENGNDDIIKYLEETSPSVILEDHVPNYPPKYLDIINDIYATIELPRGVLNCMILKVLKDKSGELPSIKYFKKVSESWIKDNIFSTIDAMKYITTMHDDSTSSQGGSSSDDSGGFNIL